MTKLRELKEFYNRYERYLIPGALIFGFVTDVLTFNLISFTVAMVILVLHLILIGANITVINLYEEKKIEGKFFSYWRVLAPLMMQYSFGNLFSAFLIFYSHSGSFFASWPFILVIIFLMVGNEIFRKYNTRPVIQISVFFFATFSFLNLLIPNLLKILGVGVFLGSGIIALLFVGYFIKYLSRYSSRVETKKKVLSYIIGGIFLGMNFLYIFNFIPPIPLSIREMGVYHDIKRVDGGYQVVTEECDAIDRCIFSHERRSIESSRQRIYVFSAVFAPRGMELEVVHNWQRFNMEERRWETIANIPFTVSGRDDLGYSWYTYYNAYPGRWRVDVRTKGGSIIERKDFYIIEGKKERINIIK